MDVFTLFTPTSYTFLQLASGSGGNKIVEEFSAEGIVKLRDGMLQTDNVESYEADSTIHIKPSESFVSSLDGNLVGHGVRVTKDGYGPLTYRIDGQVEGYDYDTNELMFYKVTLKRESIWDESDLPLE